MASPGPRIVSINELRFRPANSNDRARAGMEHAFKDVPPCSFAKDDGISPYMGADAGIDGFPDTPATHEPIHDDVPSVAQDGSAPGLSFGHKLLRSGFGLSVFVHAIAALAIGYYTTISLPDDTLLAGETVITLELLSDSEVDAQIRGEEEEVDAPEEKPVAEPIEEPVEKPVEKPVEQAMLPEPVKEPIEEPVEPVEPVVTTKEPEVLATDQPSSFAVEQAARTILDTTDIKPLPQVLPDELVVPEVVEVKREPKLAKSLPHPISKPRIIEKVAEVKPVEPKVEEKAKVVEKKPEPKKQELKKPEPKAAKTKPEKKKPVEKSKKVKGRQGADENESHSGTRTPTNRGKQKRDASEGKSTSNLRGNASRDNYKGIVQRKLERAKTRVRVAGKGNVTVGFTITANGSVINLKVRKSSGKPAVDKGALDVVRKASPFPAIPPDSGKKSYQIVVPLTFR
jgi:protein TonB